MLKLPELALEIIAAQPRIYGKPYVFPSIGDGRFNSFAQNRLLLDQTLRAQPEGAMAPWVLHATRTPFRPNIRVVINLRDTLEREKVLGHRLLADLIERIINPPTDNVVPLHKG
jgi:hypothetical protein